jgi:hypothetical protein
LGEADVVVVPGQPLRLVTPLVVAAVRGTRFIVSVALDGSSVVNTVEGQVLAVGRNGVAQVLGAGQGFQLTSSQYVNFLQESGINVPQGEWRGLDARTVERIDTQTLGDTAGTTGGQPSAEAAVGTPGEPAAAGTPSGAVPEGSVTPGSVASAPGSTATSAASTTTAATGTSAAATTAATAATGALAQVAPVLGPLGALNFFPFTIPNAPQSFLGKNSIIDQALRCQRSALTNNKNQD